MSRSVDMLWRRALRAVDTRGLLPASRARFTPRELAIEVARRGENRLVRLVDEWYYPASYGDLRGTLSDEEANGIVAALEAVVATAAVAPPPPIAQAAAVIPPVQYVVNCDLCGSPMHPPATE